MVKLLDPPVGSSLLEVGCGRGHLVKHLVHRGVEVVGIDANPEAVERSVSDNVIMMEATSLDFSDESFDNVASFHAIEHIPDLDRALGEMVRVLKPGGRMLLVYPAEPIRGLYAIPASVLAFGTPFEARRIHWHRLTPARLRARCRGIGVEHLHSEFNLLTTPQFVSLFRKR